MLKKCWCWYSGVGMGQGSGSYSKGCRGYSYEGARTTFCLSGLKCEFLVLHMYYGVCLSSKIGKNTWE